VPGFFHGGVRRQRQQLINQHAHIDDHGAAVAHFAGQHRAIARHALGGMRR